MRTTAPEKYRVKPSNSSCDPGASVDIVVSPHGGELSPGWPQWGVMGGLGLGDDSAKLDWNLEISRVSASHLATLWASVFSPVK